MTEKWRDEALTEKVDIVDMFNDEKFCDDLSRLNMRLAAHTNVDEMSPEEKNAEHEALRDFAQAYFGIQWLERPADFKIASTVNKSAESEPGITTIQGKFLNVIAGSWIGDQLVDREAALVIKDMAYRAVSLTLQNDEGRYIVLLNTENIIAAQVDAFKSRTTDQTPLGMLQLGAAVFNHVIQSDSFYHLDLPTQQMRIGNLLAQIAKGSRVLDSASEYAITVIQPSGEGVTTLHPGTLQLTLPGYLKRSTPFANDSQPPQLMLEITNDANNTITTVPANTVIDIRYTSAANTVSDDTDNTTDLLQTFFESATIRDYITDTINNLKYISDDTERVEAIDDALDKLYELLPRDFFNQSYDFDGTAFHEDTSGEITAYSVRATGADAAGMEIKYIDGQWSVVVELEIDVDSVPEIPAPQGASTVYCYIIPYSPYTMHFEASDEDMFDEGLSALCNNVADETQALVLSDQFCEASLGEQLTMLNDALKPLKELLKDIVRTPHGKVSCHCLGYYLIEMPTGGMQYIDMSTMPKSQRAILEGTARVTIPEVTRDRTEQFAGMDDFPLSRGQPMVMIKNDELDEIYYIPARSIQSVKAISTRIDAPTDEL